MTMERRPRRQQRGDFQGGLFLVVRNATLPVMAWAKNNCCVSALGLSPVFQRLILIRERCPKDLVDINKLADGRASFDFLLKETLRLQ